MNHEYEYVRHAVKIIVQLLPRLGLMLHCAAFVAIAREVCVDWGYLLGHVCGIRSKQYP